MDELVFYMYKENLASLTTNTKHTKYNMLFFLQNRPNCHKMKQDISETMSEDFSSFRHIVLRKSCLHPISSYPVIENSPVFSLFL